MFDHKGLETRDLTTSSVYGWGVEGTRIYWLVTVLPKRPRPCTEVGPGTWLRCSSLSRLSTTKGWYRIRPCKCDEIKKNKWMDLSDLYGIFSLFQLKQKGNTLRILRKFNMKGSIFSPNKGDGVGLKTFCDSDFVDEDFWWTEGDLNDWGVNGVLGRSLSKGDNKIRARVGPRRPGVLVVDSLSGKKQGVRNSSLPSQSSRVPRVSTVDERTYTGPVPYRPFISVGKTTGPKEKWSHYNLSGCFWNPSRNPCLL